MFPHVERCSFTVPCCWEKIKIKKKKKREKDLQNNLCHSRQGSQSMAVIQSIQEIPFAWT